MGSQKMKKAYLVLKDILLELLTLCERADSVFVRLILEGGVVEQQQEQASPASIVELIRDSSQLLDEDTEMEIL
jgi:hypothetical protein